MSSYISTYLTGFRSDEFIKSTLEVIVQPDIPTNQILLECLISGLENDTAIVRINTSSESYNGLPRVPCPLRWVLILATSKFLLDIQSNSQIP